MTLEQAQTLGRVSGNGKTLHERHLDVVVEPGRPRDMSRRVYPTPKSRRARDAYPHLVMEIEEGWRDAYGDAVPALRAVSGDDEQPVRRRPAGLPRHERVDPPALARLTAQRGTCDEGASAVGSRRPCLRGAPMRLRRRRGRPAATRRRKLPLPRQSAALTGEVRLTRRRVTGRARGTSTATNDDVLLRRTDGVWVYYPLDGSRRIARSGRTSPEPRLRVAGIGRLRRRRRDDVPCAVACTLLGRTTP